MPEQNHRDHDIAKEAQGEETKKTYFMYRDGSKAYHIDYFFASKSLLDKCSLEIGNITDWIDYSDHVPITVECRV
jgi:exodeoxyribonuclease III